MGLTKVRTTTLSTKRTPSRGDVSGALSAATINLPISIGYGITAFSGLGSDFLPQAAFLGISAVIMSCLLTALFSGTPTLISGPSGPITVVLISIIAEFQVVLAPYTNPENQIGLLLGAAAFSLLIGGLFQAMLGFLKFGNLTKYVPYPVISGFINGIAISLMLHQLPQVLGNDTAYTMFNLVWLFRTPNTATLLVGGLTAISVFVAAKYIPRISPSLFGLVVGTLAYYIMIATVGGIDSVPVIGEVRIDPMRAVTVGSTVDLLDTTLLLIVLPKVLFFGIILCLISSMETLMCSAAVSYHYGERFDGNRDLVAQGIGNVATALVSAVPSSGSLVRTSANMNAGGQSRWSGVICSAMILVIFLATHRQLGMIPLASLAGLIIAIGVLLFDGSAYVTFINSIKENYYSRDIGWNLLISLIVTVLTAGVNLSLAIVVGILITSANFIIKMGKSVIRRTYRCNRCPSKRIRNLEQTRHLQQFGHKILVIELQGPLFFGSAEEVAKTIYALKDETEIIIINTKRINEVDITGIQCLIQAYHSMGSCRKLIVFTHILDGDPLWKPLRYPHNEKKIDPGHFFPDIDSAIEHAEDKILCGNLCQVPNREFRLSEMDILADFNEKEIFIISGILDIKTYQQGDVIIKQGDRNRDLFLLARGTVSAKLPLRNKGHGRRLNSINAGVSFGEIAMFDNKPRSVDVVADEDVKIYRLPYRHFRMLQKQEPLITNKLVMNMALILSTRLRSSTEEIKVLLEN
jgi:SulP family sulfate permease